ncbi:MAG: C4-type zinc ribbon domain-containing protein [Verrucomicrobiales bacterium]|nr:C4-type zinc ribbon domain-containing protein [Verrucomicrobiales bacterium]
MLPEVEKLLRVQHHDQKIASLTKELAGIPGEEESIRDKLTEDQNALEEAKAALQQVEVAIKNLELDVETRRDSITKLKVQQFETKKNEEFRRMGTEIERYGEEISGLEDQEIELMEQAEEQRKAFNTAREKLKENEQSVVEEIEDLGSLAKKITSDIEAEKVTRAGHAEALEDDLLYTYDRLFNAKAGQAVVGLIDEVCNGCHTKVTKSTVVEVKAEKKITTCENCGRILYWWTDDSVGKNRGDY